jgi:hypothetical protein
MLSTVTCTLVRPSVYYARAVRIRRSQEESLNHAPLLLTGGPRLLYVRAAAGDFAQAAE